MKKKLKKKNDAKPGQDVLKMNVRNSIRTTLIGGAG